MIEQEIKKKLTLEQYQEIYKKLFDLAVYKSNYVQVNNYFDSHDFILQKNSETLRVRKKNGVLTLDYKHNKRIENGIHICYESSCPIFYVPEQLVINHYFPNIMDKNKYYLVGYMTTERINFLYDQMTISIDMNHYLGTTDYEIEIEFNSSDPSYLSKELHLDRYKDSISKYSRFAKILNNK